MLQSSFTKGCCLSVETKENTQKEVFTWNKKKHVHIKKPFIRTKRFLSTYENFTEHLYFQTTTPNVKRNYKFNLIKNTNLITATHTTGFWQIKSFKLQSAPCHLPVTSATPTDLSVIARYCNFYQILVIWN